MAVFDGSGLRFSDGNRWPQEAAAPIAVELVAAFRGVPYALPPIGHRRFSAPERFSGPFPAGTGRRLGPACPQTAWLSYYGPEVTAEDCLFLNVYAPWSALDKKNATADNAATSFDDNAATSAGGGAPVLVFLHGGSFLWGSSSVFDGSKLAAAEGMVVVSLNYRLGALGMLPAPARPRK